MICLQDSFFLWNCHGWSVPDKKYTMLFPCHDYIQEFDFFLFVEKKSERMDGVFDIKSLTDFSGSLLSLHLFPLGWNQRIRNKESDYQVYLFVYTVVCTMVMSYRMPQETK